MIDSRKFFRSRLEVGVIAASPYGGISCVRIRTVELNLPPAGCCEGFSSFSAFQVRMEALESGHLDVPPLKGYGFGGFVSCL